MALREEPRYPNTLRERLRMCVDRPITVWVQGTIGGVVGRGLAWGLAQDTKAEEASAAASDESQRLRPPPFPPIPPPFCGGTTIITGTLVAAGVDYILVETPRPERCSVMIPIDAIAMVHCGGHWG